MSISTEISRLQTAKSDLKSSIENHGVEVPSATTLDGYASLVDQINLPATLQVNATTIRKSASQTENYASNDNIRFLGSDMNKYTLAEWNAMFVEAGYDRTQMTVTPIGLSIDAFEHSGECYLFDRYTGTTYNPTGETVSTTSGYLQHSPYNNTLVTSSDSGTDYATGKLWRVTVSGDNLILYEANTGCSWTVSKKCGGANIHSAHNISERTHYLWAYTEWLRHRFAIDSGITTTASDGTMGEIEIFNSSGVQAAVGEDMYFFVRETYEDSWQNTNIKAKYNKNNRHDVNSYNFNTTADTIYNKQIEMGVNMNDSGVNSSSKHVLSTGSKGAETIAVGGHWYIITPYISSVSTTTETLTNNCADSPAVYWAVSKNCSLPSDTLLYAMYMNWTIVTSMRSYLVNVEGRSVRSIPTGGYFHTSIRSSSTASIAVRFSSGICTTVNTYGRYYVAGALET